MAARGGPEWPGVCSAAVISLGGQCCRSQLHRGAVDPVQRFAHADERPQRQTGKTTRAAIELKNEGYCCGVDQWKEIHFRFFFCCCLLLWVLCFGVFLLVWLFFSLCVVF